MKVEIYRGFNPEFPELFNWNLVEQISLSRTAEEIVDMIKEDLKTEYRVYVPGLRKALISIAKNAEIIVEGDWYEFR